MYVEVDGGRAKLPLGSVATGQVLPAVSADFAKFIGLVHEISTAGMGPDFDEYLQRATVARELAQVKRTAILKGEADIGPLPSVTVKDYSTRWLKEVAPSLTLADAGLRPSEALALRWDDVDVGASGGQAKPTKPGGRRSVELTPRLTDALGRWQASVEADAIAANRDPGPWIFADAAGPRWTCSGWRRRFRRLLAQGRVAAPPAIRHSYATHLLAMGAPITHLAAQLGHAKPTTTLAFYAHWLPAADRVWAEQLEWARTHFPTGFTTPRNMVPSGAR